MHRSNARFTLRPARTGRAWPGGCDVRYDLDSQSRSLARPFLLEEGECSTPEMDDRRSAVRGLCPEARCGDGRADVEDVIGWGRGTFS